MHIQDCVLRLKWRDLKLFHEQLFLGSFTQSVPSASSGEKAASPFGLHAMLISVLPNQAKRAQESEG